MADAELPANMIRVLLQKARGKEGISSDKKKGSEDIDAIVAQLKKLNERFDKDSKESEDSRKILIKELIEEFDKHSVSLKDQDKILKSIDEKMSSSEAILMGIDIKKLNSFFGVFSSVKELGKTIYNGIANSGIMKTISKNIEAQITNLYVNIDAMKTEIASFIKNPISYLKGFGASIIGKITDKIEKLGSFIWNNALKPIFDVVKDLSSQMVQFAQGQINIETLVISAAMTIISWMVFTVIPFLASIIGFLIFTVVPGIFSILVGMITFTFTTVIPFFISIIGSIGAFFTAMLPVIGLSIIIAAALFVLIYFVFQFWNYVKGIFTEFYDKYLKGMSWEKLKEDFSILKKYIVDEVWPMITKSWDYMIGIWKDYIEPFFKNTWKNIVEPAVTAIWSFFKDQWNNPDSLLNTVLNQIRVSMPYIMKAITWIIDKFMYAWESYFGSSAATKAETEAWNQTNSINDAQVAQAEKYRLNHKNVNGYVEKKMEIGGIVTTPTTALIGEAGDDEAVIPLNRKGIEFIRNAFNIDNATMQDILKNSQLTKSQSAIESMVSQVQVDTKNILAEIKFSASDIKKSVQYSSEKLALLINADSLEYDKGETKKIFDIKEVEKILSESDKGILKKIEDLHTILMEISTKKSDPLLNPGTSVSDSYQNLVQAISTGLIGVR